MSQNIAIATNESATQILNLATHIFEAHGPEIGDAATNKNFVLAYLKQKANVVVDGALDFAEPVLIAENSNFGWRSAYSGIQADIQDPTREFRFSPMVLDGTLVINELHKAQNSGKAVIKKLMTTLKMQAQTTISNKVNSAVWAATPGTNDPESIRSIVSTTPTTGTIGGISRVGNSYAQNKHSSTTIASIGSAAGMAALHTFRAKLGGDAKTTPDFAVTTATIWGKVVGWLDSLRQLRADEKMADLGLDTVKIAGGTTLGYDGDGGTGECPSNYLYMLNSNHLFWKVLSGGNFVFEPFSRKDNSLNATSVFYLFCNLTTNLPSSMGVLSAITG
jgi:hypothetical protein